MKVKPTKEQFKIFLICMHSGLCNVFSPRSVMFCSKYKLTEDIILYIYDHYGELENEYKISTDDVTKEDLKLYELDRLFI